MTVPYIDYNGLEEFHTLKNVCRLFKIDKEKLKEKCGQYDISPQKNEVGDWGLTRSMCESYTIFYIMKTRKM